MALDDLLRYPEEDSASTRPPVRRWFAYSWVLKPVGYAAAAGVVGWLALRAMGTLVPLPLAIMVVLVIEILFKIVRWLELWPVPEGLRRSGALRPPERREPPPDGLVLATARWDTRLAWSRLQSEPEQFARTLQPRLVQLIDERLRLRYGVTRRDRPAQARAILGEPLWTFVNAPVQRPLTPRDLTALITCMEAL